jgi:hypothetical protein
MQMIPKHSTVHFTDLRNSNRIEPTSESDSRMEAQDRQERRWQNLRLTTTWPHRNRPRSTPVSEAVHIPCRWPFERIRNNVLTAC